MVFTVVLAILALVWVALMAIQSYNGELIISPVIGFMVGWLYNGDEDVNGTEHTIQFLLGIVSFTFIWYTNE